METNQILSKILEKIESMDSRLVALEAGQEKTNERLDKMQGDIETIQVKVVTIQEDIDIIKEDTTITRTSVNTLLDWAEEAQIEVKIPLYKKAE